MTRTQPLTPAFGSEVTGVDLAEEVAGDPEAPGIENLRQLWVDRKLLLFRDQHLTPEQQLRFAGWFGEAEGSTPRVMQTGGSAPTPVHYISNRVDGGQAGDGELLFHSDSASREHPLRAVVLHALAVPDSGGETLYANCAQAYSSLPPSIRSKIAGLRAHHGYDYDRIEMSQPGGPGFHAEHPVAMRHPITAEMILYLSRNATTNLIGLPAPTSASLLEELFGYIERPEVGYTHRWRVGDVIIWDNLSLVHARTSFDPDQPRTLQRVTVTGTPGTDAGSV